MNVLTLGKVIRSTAETIMGIGLQLLAGFALAGIVIALDAIP